MRFACAVSEVFFMEYIMTNTECKDIIYSWRQPLFSRAEKRNFVLVEEATSFVPDMLANTSSDSRSQDT